MTTIPKGKDTFTPGPWLRIDKADYAEIHAAFRPSSQAVALVAKAEDADLIAAVPELLELVGILLGEDDRFIPMIGGNPNAIDEMLDRARAVFAKARGR